jgi:hypothetical protein
VQPGDVEEFVVGRVGESSPRADEFVLLGRIEGEDVFPHSGHADAEPGFYEESPTGPDSFWEVDPGCLAVRFASCRTVSGKDRSI